MSIKDGWFSETEVLWPGQKFSLEVRAWMHVLILGHTSEHDQELLFTHVYLERPAQYLYSTSRSQPAEEEESPRIGSPPPSIAHVAIRNVLGMQVSQLLLKLTREGVYSIIPCI